MEGFKNLTAERRIFQCNLKRRIEDVEVQKHLTRKYRKKYAINSGYYSWVKTPEGEWQLWDVYNQRPCYIVPAEGTNVIISPQGKYHEYNARIPLKILPELPNNVLQHVFSFLPPDSLLICQLVCRKWREISSIPTLWIHVPMYKGLEDITNGRIRYIQATFYGFKGDLKNLISYFQRRPVVKDWNSLSAIRRYIRENEQQYRSTN